MRKERMVIGKATVDISWFGEEITQALHHALVEELTPVMSAMEADAKNLCPVSSKEKASPMHRYEKEKFQRREGGRKYNLKKTDKHGHKINVLGKKIKRTTGKKWESRQPGRLRDSIRASVHMRHDRTAVIGFLEAGSEDAFYASYVELGTYKMNPKPFLRPAFNRHKRNAIEAARRAVAKVSKT